MADTLSVRKTRRFVGAYQHEDEWQDIGTVKVEASNSHQTDEDMEDPCEPWTTTLFCCVDADSTASEDLIEQALRDTYTKWGCAHEYDCCGCRSYAVTDVKKLAHDYYRVVIHSSRNY